MILFVNGTDTPETRAIAEKKLPDFETWYKIHNITVDNRTITAVERLADAGPFNADPSKPSLPEHDLFQVHFTEGEPVQRAAFVTNWPSEQRSKLGEQSGVQLWGGKLAADMLNGMIINVPGIYAVGDANSDDSTNIPHALWSGKRAVVSLHVTLEEENAELEVASVGKRSEQDRIKDLWNTINDGDDVLNAGEFERSL